MAEAKGVIARAKETHAQEVLAGRSDPPSESEMIGLGDIYMNVLTPEQRLKLVQLVTNAALSQDLRGHYGRIEIYLDICDIILQTGDQFLPEYKEIVSIAKDGIESTKWLFGQDISGISDKTRDSIATNIIIPCLRAKDSRQVEHFLIVWYRDRDATLRNMISAYFKSEKRSPDLTSSHNFMLRLSINHVRYTAGSLRRMTNLIKIAYPDKVKDMDTVYDTASNMTDIFADEYESKNKLILEQV